MTGMEGDIISMFTLCQRGIRVGAKKDSWQQTFVPLPPCLQPLVLTGTTCPLHSQGPKKMLNPVPAAGQTLVIQEKAIHFASDSFRRKGLCQSAT